MITRNSKLYFLVLALMSAVVIIAAGGGLFGEAEPWILQWQHQAFAALCHQIPERSIWLNGQPMAVCSRCFGIYTGFFIIWLLLPNISHINNKQPLLDKRMLISALVINVVDIAGNMVEFWQNTLISRLVLGVFIGLAAAALFSGSFFIKTINKSENRYGGVTTLGSKQ